MPALANISQNKQNILKSRRSDLNHTKLSPNRTGTSYLPVLLADHFAWFKSDLLDLRIFCLFWEILAKAGKILLNLANLT